MDKDEQQLHEDKRKRTRVDIQLNAVIQCTNQEIQTQTQNISLKGILCLLHSLQEGKVCEVIIWLSEEEYIQVQGEVVRTSQEGTAIDFIKMSSESFSHLYNLVRLNSQDPDKLDEELKYPAFGK